MAYLRIHFAGTDKVLTYDDPDMSEDDAQTNAFTWCNADVAVELEIKGVHHVIRSTSISYVEVSGAKPKPKAVSF